MRLIYEVSPFTGNRCLAIEPDAEKQDYMKLCMETGYHTYDINWKVGSEVIDIVEQYYPNILIDTKKIMDGNVWYKLILNTPFAVLTPEYAGDDMIWAIYTLKDGNPNKDEIVMEIENPNGDHPIYRTIDVDSKVVFKDTEFGLAMDRYQMIVASVYGKIAEIIKEEEE